MMNQKLNRLRPGWHDFKSRSQISLKTQETLTQLQSAGHIVSIVTGRPNRLSEPFYHQLGSRHRWSILTAPSCIFLGKIGPTNINTPLIRNVVFSLFQLKERFKIQMIAAEGKTMFLADQATAILFRFSPQRSNQMKF